MTVIKLNQFRTRDTVRALETLLSLAKHGKILGLVFACKCHTQKHELGITGDYIRDPVAAIGVSSQLLSRVQKLYDERQLSS